MDLQRRIFITALIINTSLFFFTLTFFTATYHSYDDVYPLYLLSGATGSPPSNLLHYNHIIHPVLGGIVAKLFSLKSSVNWFSAVLYFFQFCAWLNIFYLFLRFGKRLYNIVLCILLFFVFGAPLLLQLTFTDTSYLLYCSALLSILFYSFQKYFKVFCLFVPVVLLLLGLLLRIHTLLPILALSGGFLLFSKRRIMLIGFFATLGILVLIINLIHTHYYTRRIPSWQSEEAYRHAVLSYDNHFKSFDSSGASEKLKLQERWLKNGILIDPSFIDKQAIDNIIQRKSGMRSVSEIRPAFKWYIINNRIFFGVVFLLLSFSFLKPNKKETIAISIQFIIWIALHIVLIFFLKVPSTFLIVTAFFNSLILLYFISQKEIPLTKYGNILRLTFTLLFFSWSFIRLNKISESNSIGRAHFLNAWKEVTFNKDKLFIVPYDGFPFEDFGTFDNPADYPIYNVITKHDWMNNTHLPFYKTYNIHNSLDLLKNKNVRFLGNKNAYIREFALMKYNLEGDFIKAPENYKQLEVSIFVPIK